MLEPLKNLVKDISLGFQGLIVIFTLLGLRKLFSTLAKRIEPLRNKVVCETLLVYAFIWMLITVVLLNELPKNLFDLAS